MESDIFNKEPFDLLIIAWIVGSFFFLINSILQFRYLKDIQASFPSARKTVYVQIFILSVVESVTCYLCLFYVAFEPIMEVVRATYEAFVIHWFVRFLIREASQNEGGLAATVLAVPKKRLWASPPCCCVLYPCVQPMRLNTHGVELAEKLTLQYCCVRFCCAILFVIFHFGVDDHDHNNAIGAEGVQTVSMFVAFWALLVIYRGVVEALKHIQPTYKIMAIKFVLIIATGQSLIIDIFIRPRLDDSGDYDEEDRAVVLKNFIMIVETTVMTCLLLKGFPKHELDLVDTRDEVNPLVNPRAAHYQSDSYLLA
eukprot:TRINITY_DN2071_c0_g1::TRINITY_DN2071_c0_g1_i1::g.21828::m.21828 TRINITY_DN2071_c0_g1::TRINITY_DN2071_c0_g1_i1::g.21828  ORF type:complete len:312 (+),score=63.09,sp/Q6ZMB5/T184A_HUMAN/28.05/1e-09,Solute_trans_a/PF03619.11/6.1e-27,DUF3262/PF11660.3/1.6e+03,DUF3262/PF11660.3/0.082,DUF3533/PF12051.3/0.38,DUF3533/PF12051.3/2.4e+02 TRINITY_DN2071_c0_g1_i1:108-1043(+)